MYYDVNLEIDYKAIGARIRAARERKGLKQHNLAALAEVAPTNISHIERGVAKASLPTLMKIANSLEVSMPLWFCPFSPPSARASAPKSNMFHTWVAHINLRVNS